MADQYFKTQLELLEARVLSSHLKFPIRRVTTPPRGRPTSE
jgi:hypothetical protein